MAAKQTKTKQGEALRKQGAAWLDRIKAATKAEKEWMDDAEKATKAYTGEANAQEGSSTLLGKTYDFNILFSNVETIVPAVINSPPAPDIRRRFADDDPAAKDVSELLERAIRIQIDDSKLQVEMEAEAQDIFLAGRGVIRLRFKSDFVKDAKDEISTDADRSTVGGTYGVDTRSAGQNQPAGGEDGLAATDRVADEPEGGGNVQAGTERLANERITFEAVSWRDYRHGPAKRWDERPWEAFRFCIAREDEAEAFDPNLIQSQLDENEYKTRSGASDELTGWEIWCKKTRKVHFVDEDGVLLKTVDDPLDLTQFFSTATPAQAIEVTGRLKPVNPFSIYSNLADELDLTTKRINLITDEMRVKGWYSGDAGDIANMLNAKDVEFVPIKDAEIWAQNGGLANAVAWWPIEKFVVVLKELYAAREQTKQAIYEITGISDIVRGASKSNETLGAQQIKTQWGSLRIQKMQRMLERTARDLFVMMAEIIPSKFSFETLQKMTGIQLIPTEQDMTPVVPPQVPQMPDGAPPEAQQQAQAAQQQAQEAEKARLEKLAKMQAIQKLLNEPLAMMYRIDVESDSTVKADLSRQKAESAEFLTGAASYFQAVGPLVQEGAMPMDAAVEIFAANARLFNLGKSVEDTLDKMITDAKAKAGQPAPPNPEQQKAEAEAKAREQEAQQKAADRQADMQAKQQDAAAKAQERSETMQMKREEHGFKMQEMEMDRNAKMIDLQAKGDDRQFQRENEAEKMGFEREKHGHAMQAKKADTDGKRAEMGMPSDDMTEAFTGLVKSVADSQEKMAEAIDKLATAQLAPKSITTPDGRTFTAKTTVN